jgi:hypothetical protein
MAALYFTANPTRELAILTSTGSQQVPVELSCTIKQVQSPLVGQFVFITGLKLGQFVFITGLELIK